jgi:DNA-binding LytR/AlgR family response regulator
MELKEGREEKKISQNPDYYPKKMVLKQGIKHFLLDIRDIVYCYSNNKVAYIVDVNNQKYIADKNLIGLEAELDPRLFFKVNRTHIINFNFILSFVTHEKNKIRVELKTAKKEQVVVSQTRVHDFKQWIYQQL